MLGFFASVVLSSAPVLSGLFQVSQLGLVEFSQVDGKIVGRYRGAGACKFSPDKIVVQGDFVNEFFMGTVQVCQVGDNCSAEVSYPFLALFKSEALAASVHIRPGCDSPGIVDGELSVAKATPEELEALKPKPLDAARHAGNEVRKTFEEYLKDGFGAEGRKDFERAKESFSKAMEFKGADWRPMFGLGTAKTKLGEYDEAVVLLTRASVAVERDASVESKRALSDIYFNLACSYARLGKTNEALVSLNKAAAQPNGPSIQPLMVTDPDLKALRLLPDFKKLSSQLLTTSSKQKIK
jgi:tetratricopeptide (TPR) repeat protein